MSDLDDVSSLKAEVSSLKADIEGYRKALNAVSVPADVRKLKARVKELEASTALLTFNEACKRIEALEAELREITTKYDWCRKNLGNFYMPHHVETAIQEARAALAPEQEP